MTINFAPSRKRATAEREALREADALLERTAWQEVQDGLEVRMVEHPDGVSGEKYVLCRSSAREE